MEYYVGVDVSLKSTHICIMVRIDRWCGAGARTRSRQ